MPRRDFTPALVLTLGLAAAIPVVASAGVITTALAADGVVALQSDPAADAAEREKLFAALAKSANAAEAQGIASQIWTLWFKAPNTDAAVLMQQALDRRTAGDYQGSAALLDTLVEADPDWAEAWNQRATMRYLLNDFDGSLADIEHVLALEPKHFGALSGQALILMHQGRMEAGQAALRRAVAIDPFLSERALLMQPTGQDI